MSFSSFGCASPSLRPWVVNLFSPGRGSLHVYEDVPRAADISPWELGWSGRRQKFHMESKHRDRIALPFRLHSRARARCQPKPRTTLPTTISFTPVTSTKWFAKRSDPLLRQKQRIVKRPLLRNCSKLDTFTSRAEDHRRYRTPTMGGRRCWAQSCCSPIQPGLEVVQNILYPRATPDQKDGN